MMIWKPTIIFDWGSVLCSDDNLLAAEELSKKYNCNYDELLDLLENEDDYSCSSDYNGYINKITDKFWIPGQEIIDWKNKTVPHKTFALCHELRKRWYDLYLLSDQMKFRADFIKNNYDLSCFTQVFFSCDIWYIKPNKNSFLHVINKTNIVASDTIFIDDSEKNIKVAESVDITGILYTDLEALNTELKKYNI